MPEAPELSPGAIAPGPRDDHDQRGGWRTHSGRECLGCGRRLREEEEVTLSAARRGPLEWEGERVTMRSRDDRAVVYCASCAAPVWRRVVLALTRTTGA